MNNTVQITYYHLFFTLIHLQMPQHNPKKSSLSINEKNTLTSNDQHPSYLYIILLSPFLSSKITIIIHLIKKALYIITHKNKNNSYNLHLIVPSKINHRNYNSLS